MAKWHAIFAPKCGTKNAARSAGVLAREASGREPRRQSATQVPCWGEGKPCLETDASLRHLRPHGLCKIPQMSCGVAGQRHNFWAVSCPKHENLVYWQQRVLRNFTCYDLGDRMVRLWCRRLKPEFSKVPKASSSYIRKCDTPEPLFSCLDVTFEPLVFVRSWALAGCQPAFSTSGQQNSFRLLHFEL